MDTARANSKAKLNDLFRDYCSEIDITNWFDQRVTEIDEIVSNQDYNRALGICNKGLKQITNNAFRISEFINYSINFLQREQRAKDALYKYFPRELRNNES